MSSLLEYIYDFLGQRTTKFLFLSFLLLFTGAFILNMYESGQNTVCKEAKFIIERNIEIEYNLRKNGQIEDANKLHKSLVGLAERLDDCDFSLLKLLKRRRV
jgi:hypothetical protein